MTDLRVAIAVAGGPGDFSFDAGGDWSVIEAACAGAGISAIRTRWDDGAVDWPSFAGVVIRSRTTWKSSIGVIPIPKWRASR